MTVNRNTAPGAISEAEVSSILIEPLLQESKFTQISTVISGVAGSALRVPKVVDDDDHVLFVAEGDSLDVASPAIVEFVLPWYKVGSVTPITRELLEDAAQGENGLLETIGRSLSRSLANRIDKVSFGGAAPADGWAGIQQSHADFHDAGTTDLQDVDAILDGIALVRESGGEPASVVTSPHVAAELAKSKRGTGSNEPLLGASAADALSNTVAGLPIITSKHVAPGAIYVLAPTFAVFGVHRDAQVETDSSVYFDKDSYACRITLRASAKVIQPEHAAVISTDLGSV